MQTRFSYVKADGVRKTIAYDYGKRKTVTDATIPQSYWVTPDVLDFNNQESARAFVNSARILGSPLFNMPPDGRRCVSKVLKEGGRNAQAVTRTKDDFAFLPGPGLMFVDCDMKDPLSHYRPLWELAPALVDVLRLEYYSSSSHLYISDPAAPYALQISGTTGRHIILCVEDAQAIPQMGEWLYLRSWLAGGGYIHVTPNGRALDRSYIDQAVWQPERLVFGHPTTKAPLYKEHYEPERYAGRLLRADDLYLTPEQEHQARSMIAQAKATAMQRPETVEMMRAFAAQNLQPGDTIEAAIRRNQKYGELGQLPPYMQLQTSLGVFSVREIYQSFSLFYETSMADPLEPWYGNGDQRIAMFVKLYGDKPGIFSHAHGGQEWLLMPAIVDEEVGRVIEQNEYYTLEEEAGM